MGIYTKHWLNTNNIIQQQNIDVLAGFAHWSKTLDLSITADYVLCEHVEHIVFVWPEQFDVFAYVSNDVKKLLKEKRIFLIFNMSNEGGYPTFPHYRYFYESSITHGIPQEQIIFLTGGQTEDTVYKNLFPESKIHTVVIHLEDYRVLLVSKFKSNPRASMLAKNFKTKYFTYLSRRPRFWRSALTKELHADPYLQHRALLSHGIIGSDGKYATNADILEFADGDEVTDAESREVVDYFTKVGRVMDPGTQFNINHVYGSLDDLYHQVLFDVVGESYQTMSRDCITEKTFKAIYAEVPVLIWGTPGINKQLTMLGLKQYNEWFDYSFDDEEDDTKRMHLLVKEIKRVCMHLDSMSHIERISWSLKNKEVLKHNKAMLGELPFIRNNLTKLLNILNT
jgi:hypothetical protein